MSEARPILLLELNEVPWSVIDRVCKADRWPSIRRLFARARTHTTLVPPGDELSPWISWPTLHRGMSAREHGVSQLGQDISTFRGVPIWEEVRRRGGTIGVCGSLQSWPPIEAGTGGFYVPDTFARDERCIPERIEPLQGVSLRAVARNARVVRRDRVLSLRHARLAPALLRAGVRLRTLAQIGLQIAAERADAERASRRPTFQARLLWDAFLSLYDPRRPPSLATFFTNHVAGFLHRSWDDAFDDDRGGGAFFFAVDLVEVIAKAALAWLDICPSLIVGVAGGMGQERVARHHEGHAAVVHDVEAFLHAVGQPPGSFTRRLAMAPQIAVELADREARERLRDVLSTVVTAEGKETFVGVSIVGDSVSMTIVTPPPEDVAAGGFLVGGGGSTPRFVAWSDAGITMHRVDAGTGGHVRQGVLALVGRGIDPDTSRSEIDLRSVKSTLLDLSGL